MPLLRPSIPSPLVVTSLPVLSDPRVECVDLPVPFAAAVNKYDLFLIYADENKWIQVISTKQLFNIMINSTIIIDTTVVLLLYPSPL